MKRSIILFGVLAQFQAMNCMAAPNTPQRPAPPKANPQTTEQNLSFLFILEAGTQWSLIVQSPTASLDSTSLAGNSSGAFSQTGTGGNRGTTGGDASANPSLMGASGSASSHANSGNTLLEKNGKPTTVTNNVLVMEGNTKGGDVEDIKPPKVLNPSAPNT